ncbi:GET complex subunit get1 [Pichia californica]|uniref:GET complex subunit get1 n=1 Tax=Pichia californica TaxID=460514 RepID=A0A9P6WJJ2_9ASCO|nr:GET complex subunit get1 [[Candida] californica]KAG0688107.1 GET complex subunit get1 [[Candida] californica]
MDTSVTGTRLIIEPFLTKVTVVVLFSFLLSTFIDRQKTSKWISSYFYSDKSQISKLNLLMKESRSIESERNKLSAQDHYAKWTKLNRKLDKLNDEIKLLSKNIQSSQLVKVGKISSILLFLEKIPLYFIRFWYSRTPVILIESNSLFNSFGFQRFILNMPFGEKNIVSTLFWCIALDIVLQTLYNFGSDVYNTVNIIRSSGVTVEKRNSKTD